MNCIEIYLKHHDIYDRFQQLTPQERIFVYYMQKACVPFNIIRNDQNHRHNNELIKLFEFFEKNIV